jgi:HlyD family secretion protein
MRFGRREVVVVLGVLILAGAGFLVLRPSPVTVEVATVARGHFVATVEDDGRTRVRDRYIVSAPLAGRLLRPRIRAGDAVAEDQILATILPSLPSLLDPRTQQELQERLGRAEATIAEVGAQVDRAQAVLRQAEADAQRARILRQSGVAAVQQVERAELAARTAERELRAAEQRRHAAEHELDQTRALLRRIDQPDPAERLDIRSPVAGRVLRVVRESEAPVTPGDPIIEVGDPGNLEVIVDVLTTEAVRIRSGAAVTIEHWGGSELLEGRVRFVEPGAFTKVSALGVEEQRVFVVIDITSPRERWLALGDGFRVDARIATEEIPDALLLPVSALFRRDGSWAVFTVKDGIARERRVEIVLRGASLAAVAQGLGEGESAIVFPPSSLADGARVRIVP